MSCTKCSLSGRLTRGRAPELQRLLDQLRAGDILVVWKFDRLSRSLRDVLTIMERLGESKGGFRSLTEVIDTTTAAGRMMMQTVGAFAESERAMLQGCTRAGLEVARQEGRVGGRRPKPSDHRRLLQLSHSGGCRRPHTTVRAIRSLSPVQAAQARPVRIRGVVTVVSGWKSSFFFQDASFGISVDRTNILRSFSPDSSWKYMGSPHRASSHPSS
jgi:Resolvase, N terminal domain